MQTLKALFKFYIHASIHVALAICALAGVTVMTYHLDWNWVGIIFLFTASITGYNFTKYYGEAKFHHRSLTKRLKQIQLFSLVCFLGLAYVTFQESFHFRLVNVVLAVMTFLYAIPLLPRHKNLRHIKILKIVVVGLVWAGATVWLPMIDQRSVWSGETMIKTLSHLFFVLALILPFEIRDLQYDDPDLGTLPQLYGIKNTKRIGYGLLVLFILFNTLAPHTSKPQIFVGMVIALLVAASIFFSEKERGSYFAAFWVEAIPIVWFLLLWIFS